MIFNTDYRLEDYILGSNWENFPEDVKSRAVVCAIDLTIALLLGSQGRQHKIGAELSKNIYQPGDVRIVGSDARFNFMGATVAMAHAANSFDIDDGHNMIRGHPGASFIGGVLAASLDRDVTYIDFLTALVISYEVTIRWALAMQDYYKFMHSTGAYGAFGSTAGVGRIFRLDRETLNNALSIADFHAPMVPVMRAVEYPSMNKDGVPFGTMIGATSVIEAMMGYQGRTHLLEMPKYSHFLDTLGTQYEIMNLYFKPFTCCRWAHQPISACLKMIEEYGISSEAIEKITVHTFNAAARLSKIEPKTTDEAQYNIAYPVAAAIVYGDLGYPQVRDEALGDKRVLGIMNRMDFVVDSDIEAQFPKKRLAWVEMRLKDNRLIKSDIFAAPGEASDGIDISWVKEKFVKRTSPLISETRQKQILSAMSNPSDMPISAITDIINGK
jgi:2-methylcitrate dehydratase PrpD